MRAASFRIYASFHAPETHFERKNLAKDPKYSKILAEHRALLDDYITRSKDDYRSLKVDADPRCRNHTPGYPSHEGPGAREILKRK